MALEVVIPFILLMFLSLYQVVKSSAPSKHIYYAIVVYIIIFAGIRDRIGPDWPGYEIAFWVTGVLDFDLESFENAAGMEIGYLLMNYAVGLFTDNINVFYTLFAGIAIYLKASTIFKYCHFAYIGLAAYFIPSFFIEEIIQIRQGMAIALTIYSVRYIINRKKWKFILFMIIAFNIHSSSIIFFPAYWIARIQFSSFQMIALLGISIILSQVEFITFLSPILLLLPLEKVQEGVNYVFTDYSSSAAFTFGDVSKVVFTLLLIQYKKYILSKDKTFVIFLNFFFYASVLYFTFRSDLIFASRLTAYYSAFIYITIPYLLYLIMDKKLDFRIMYMGFVLYMVLMYFNFQSIHRKTYQEYYNVWYNKNHEFDHVPRVNEY